MAPIVLFYNREGVIMRNYRKKTFVNLIQRALLCIVCLTMLSLSGCTGKLGFIFPERNLQKEDTQGTVISNSFEIDGIKKKVESREPLTRDELDKLLESKEFESIKDKIKNKEQLTNDELRKILEKNKENTLSMNPEPTLSPTPKPTSKKTLPKNYDWVINVNDTKQYKYESIIWYMDLYILMNKEGGTDPTGEYNGNILLKAKIDAAVLAEAMEEDLEDMIIDSTNAEYSTEAEVAKIEVIKYDSKEFEKFSVELANDNISPILIGVNYLAMNSIDMKTIYNSRVDGHDMIGNKGWAYVPKTIITKPVPVRILIIGSKVKVYFGKDGALPVFDGKIEKRPREY